MSDEPKTDPQAPATAAEEEQESLGLQLPLLATFGPSLSDRVHGSVTPSPDLA